jgi:hypothetical protein
MRAYSRSDSPLRDVVITLSSICTYRGHPLALECLLFPQSQNSALREQIRRQLEQVGEPEDAATADENLNESQAQIMDSLDALSVGSDGPTAEDSW